MFNSSEMLYPITNKANSVTDAVTLAVSAKANLLQKNGHDTCNLSAGAPQVDTPAHIKEGAKKALDDGQTKYSIVQGEIELRRIISKKLSQENGLNYEIENIVVTNGGKQALYSIMQALISKGDEVLIPSPYWLSFPDIVVLAEGTPVFVAGDPSNHYKVTASNLEKAITKNTRILIFNSPANPTGGVYSLDEIKAIADIIVKYNLIVISDEIFEKIVYDNLVHHSIATLGNEIFNRTIIVNGFSKIYSMTGWRVGYLAAPLEIAKAVTRIQSHQCSNVCLFAQVGSMLCYSDPRSQIAVDELVFNYNKKRHLIVGL
jgi:aspartate aminotransferase